MIRYVATNLTDLHREPSFLSELLTQVTNGVALDVQKEDGKFCYVRQTDGYEGWAYAPYLTGAPPPKPTHLLAIHCLLRAAPVEKEVAPGHQLTSLPIGTAVSVVETRDRWARVQ